MLHEPKKWKFYKFSCFSYVLSNPIILDRNNAKEIILSIDEAVMIAGFKYEIANFLYSSLLIDNMTNNIRFDYKPSRSKEFWINGFNDSNLYSCFRFHHWRKYQDSNYFKKYDYPETILYEEKEGRIIKKRYGIRGQWNGEIQYHPVVSLSSSSFFMENENEKQKLGIGISSSSDIWFEKIEFDDGIQSEIVDNKQLAYLNTPRFNSYLRDIKLVLRKFGTDLIMDIEDNISDTITDDGILLDGRIIYQEDIEDGTVIL